MNVRTLVILLLLIGGIFGLAWGGLALWNDAAQAKRDLAVARANAAAKQDTVTMYQDSLSQTRSLMQFQDSIRTDSITDLLESLGQAIEGRRQTLVALNTLRVEFRTLREEFVSSTVTEVPTDTVDSESRQGTFEIAGPPIEGTLWVTYRPNAPWGLRTAIRPSPFDLTYSIGCDEENNVLVNVTAPPWAPATPAKGTVSPDVCNPIGPVGFSLLPNISPKGIAWELAKGTIFHLLWELIEEQLEDDSGVSR